MHLPIFTQVLYAACPNRATCIMHLNLRHLMTAVTFLRGTNPDARKPS